jgi:hypothetical protein
VLLLSAEQRDVLAGATACHGTWARQSPTPHPDAAMLVDVPTRRIPLCMLQQLHGRSEVSWQNVRQGLDRLAHRAWRRRPMRPAQIAGSHASLPTNAFADNRTRSLRLEPLEEAEETTARCPPGDQSEIAKVQLWRRRGLQRRGAFMRVAMAATGGRYSLAMLDQAGIVVSWYDRGIMANAASDDVVDDHMNQFYVLNDVVAGRPQRHLRIAAENGTSTNQGWRRHAGGAAYWGTTVIQALRNRNGQLQGFSHLTHESQGPHEDVRSSTAAITPRPELNLDRFSGYGVSS